MAVPKRQPSRWHFTHIVGALAVVLCSGALIKLSFASNCDRNLYMKDENKHPNEFNGPKTQKTPSLSSRQSYGFLDDITDDSWKLLQERVRSSTMYANPENPAEGYQSPMHWYMKNLQVRETVVRAKVLAPSGNVSLTLYASSIRFFCPY
jgi:hypothetical protein